jgi:hypothetical protein
VAASFASSSRTLTLYLDGVQVARGKLASLSKGNSLPVQIGRNGAVTGRYLSGKLDDVRLWSRARSGSDIARDYKTQLNGPQPGLVANWHFDDGTGTKAVDSSGNKHDATLSGGASFTTVVHL